MYADISDYSICSIFIGRVRTRTMTMGRLFRNVGAQNSDAAESHKRKSITFTKRRKFEIKAFFVGAFRSF